MDTYHAYGDYTWSNGDNYLGEYNHGKQHGHAIFTWADGRKYDGPYKDDVMHGIGFLHAANGQITKVEYCKGELVREIDP